MKLRHLLFGGLLVGMMASCTNELDLDEGKILENETTTYVRLSLVGEGSTRADYENGTADESAVQSILLTFFDAGRNYVGKSTVTIGETAEKLETGFETPGGSLERILTVVAPVNLPENINYPKYVVAYVNPTSKSNDLATDKLEDAMKYIRARAEVSPSGYRTMNNSMYFDPNSGYSRFATEVDFTKQFFETMDEAKNATDATIEITVERMEAKVRVSTPINEITQTPLEIESGLEPATGNDKPKYTLEFVPDAWFVNGTEKRSFLLKNFRSHRDNIASGHYLTTDFGLTLDGLKNAFMVNNQGDKREDYVNDAMNMRSYWAIDPTYFTETEKDIYPDVSYDVQYGEINPDATVYPLQYRSYSNVIKEWNNHTSTNYVKFNGNVKTHEYVLENTMSYNTLTSTDAMASMSSVVLLGHYVVKNAAGVIVFDGSGTNKEMSFYVRHEGENGKKYSVMLSDNDAKEFFLERGGSTLFVQSIDKDGNKLAGQFEPLRAAHIRDGRYGVTYDDFELVYPSSVRTGGKKLSEQWRTMALKRNAAGDVSNNIFVYDASLNSGAGGYRNVYNNKETEHAQDFESLAQRLYSTYGVIEKFQTGKAYFNVPLKHIWNAGETSNKFDAKKVVLGDFGVVRNHIYDLAINKITGLGTGIGDIDQPIVPPTDNENYYISTRLRILAWRLVNQSVDL